MGFGDGADGHRVGVRRTLGLSRTAGRHVPCRLSDPLFGEQGQYSWCQDGVDGMHDLPLYIYRPLALIPVFLGVVTEIGVLCVDASLMCLDRNLAG